MATRAEIVAALATLSPDELQGIVGAAQARGATSSTPKLSPAIDAIADDQVDDVIEACARGLELEQKDDGETLSFLTVVAPALAAACAANSRYRRQSYAHSVRAVKTRLEARKGA